MQVQGKSHFYVKKYVHTILRLNVSYKFLVFVQLVLVLADFNLPFYRSHDNESGNVVCKKRYASSHLTTTPRPAIKVGTFYDEDTKKRKGGKNRGSGNKDIHTHLRSFREFRYGFPGLLFPVYFPADNSPGEHVPTASC